MRRFESAEKKAKEKAKGNADRKRGARESDISIGAEVLLKNLPGNKLTTNFGPEVYTVIKMNDGDCVIKSDASGVEWRRNISALKDISRIEAERARQAREANRPPSPFLYPSFTPQITDTTEDLEVPPKRTRRPPDHLKDYVARAIQEEKEGM